MRNAHDNAMRLTFEAQLLLLQGRNEAAREQIEHAAQLEERAADASSPEHTRTRGILRVSAVSLWFQAGYPGRAAALAARYLNETITPEFARQLDELRASCLREEQAARRLLTVGLEFTQRARERELELARGDITSGTVTGIRHAARVR